jgi:hypothetical protein
MTKMRLQVRSLWRGTAWPVVFAGLAGPFLVNCGMIKDAVTGGAQVAMHGGCPDMSDTAAIDKFDFAGAFSLPAPAAAKVKAGVTAAVEMQNLATKIDGDLTTACGALAKDLGDATVYKNGPDACKAAAHAVGDAKAKIGPKATVQLDVTAPRCGVDVGAYSQCATSCDPTIKAGSVDVQCEGDQMQGTWCTGTVKPPQMSVDCKTRCDAHVQASGSCTPPQVTVTINGAADPAAAAQLQTALQKDLPQIVSTGVGIAKNAGSIVSNAKALGDGVIAVIKSGPANKAVTAALLACVAAPLKGVVDATASIQGDVSVSLTVQGSVSGGATATASAGATASR